MKRDLESAKMHDADYQSAFNLENSIKRIGEYDNTDLFAKNGFKEAVERARPNVEIHLDIGAGSGWLIRKTAPYFKRVIAVDPSPHAIEIAKEINRDKSNIEYLNVDMIEATQKLKNLNEPIFITTAIVLSHIKDRDVKEFLQNLNDFPTGSILYFDEPYNSNIQQKLWRIRHRKWWQNNLSKWRLTFQNRPGPHLYGIYGIRSEVEAPIERMAIGEKIQWSVNGMINKLRRLGRGLRRLINK